MPWGIGCYSAVDNECVDAILCDTTRAGRGFRLIVRGEFSTKSVFRYYLHSIRYTTNGKLTC